MLYYEIIISSSSNEEINIRDVAKCRMSTSFNTEVLMSSDHMQLFFGLIFTKFM